jgi:hypothetical protein
MPDDSIAPEKRRGIAASILFPAQSVRISIALLLTFFPCAILYWLEYPAPELIALSAWIWAFPSTVGFLAFLLAPLIPTAVYGYWAFNLFCVIANLSIAWSAANAGEWPLEDVVKMHRFVRGCMLITLGICLLQIATDQSAWMTAFPHMKLEAGRGAGFRLEPSQIASLLALYLIFLLCRLEMARCEKPPGAPARTLLPEAAMILLGALVLTRSISALIVVVCFVPALIRVRRKQVVFAALLLFVFAGTAYLVFGDRFNDAVETSGGDVAEFVTTSLGSWRNTPDLLILANPRDFLLPGNPGEVRLRLHDSAVLLSPLLGWIQNTFTLFSAGGISVGLPITAGLMLGALVAGLRRLSSALNLRVCWLAMSATAWFVTAKWDPTAWIVLGLLPFIVQLSAHKSSRPLPAQT